MVFRDKTYSVLLVSSSENFNTTLTGQLPMNLYYPIHKVSDAASARRRVLEMDFDLILINTPLPDEQGMKLAREICEKKDSAVLLFLKNDIYADVSERVIENGIFPISKPATLSTINQALLYLCAMRERIRMSEKKQASIDDKIDEIRVVNKAKWLLIDTMNLTEPEAHRYIEKQAMDSRCSRREVAEQIINRSESTG